MKRSQIYACVTSVVGLAVPGFALGLATAPAAEVTPGALRTTALAVFKPLPDRMTGSEKDTPALVALGKALYFEKSLSENREQSCNTCHRVDGNRAGVDNESTSEGAFGKRGGRNSPTTWNAGMHFAQFWDGRAATLEDQAKGPVLNPVEMAMPNEAEVVQRLKAAPGYPTQFKQAFPDQGDPITYDNMARAIAAFERTLISRDRLDDFLKGKDDALTPTEQKGLAMFLEVGCTTCHNGPTIGATTYQKVGLVNAYPTDDKGRSVVSKDEDDDFKFKVPSLRNIALTYPYFHNGKVPTLPEAVKTMGWLQLGKDLTADEVGSLTAFLKSLTGRGLLPVLATK
jgi:cytochrome c peroxidase